jgi:hypothetical protein
MKQNIKFSAKDRLGLYEGKQHKPWFDDECSQILGQRKRAKMQWLQNPKQNNVDILNNIRCKASRHFTHNKKVWLKGKIN